MTSKFYSLFWFALVINNCSAQISDSLHVSIGAIGSVATKNYQPLWLISNKWGTIKDRQFDVATHISVTNEHNNIGTNKPKNRDANGIYIKYGADLYLNNHLRDIYFEQLFVKGGFKNLELRLGRFEELIGVVDPVLSSGSLGISGNALPIPKIGLAVTKFTDVPFTNGWLQFKGTFAHGWIGNNNYLKGVFLHEKTFYLRVGKSRWHAVLGGQHYAEWGGHRQDVRLGRSFDDFLNILLVRWANDGSWANPSQAGSFAGDSRIFIEGSLQWTGDNVDLDFYQQSPFESGDGFSFKSKDALRGISITFNKKETGVKKIVAEVLYTKQMFDFVPIGYRETYYNNWMYKTGWEYNNMIIGTPLFINRTRGSQYFSTIKPLDWNAPAASVPMNSNIINNRVIGLNVGLAGRLIRNISFKTKFTFTRNYGTYYAGPFYKNPMNQYYNMIELAIPLSNNKLIVKSALGVDFGKLSNNSGLQLSAQWKLR